jgi:hypothetical protein
MVEENQGVLIVCFQHQKLLADLLANDGLLDDAFTNQ